MKSNTTSTLKSFAGYMLGRVVAAKVIPALGTLEPGRWPHPKYGPLEIPPPEEKGLLPFRLTTAGYFMAYGALIVYLAKRKPKAGAAQETSGTKAGLDAPQDPVEACLAGSGWNLGNFRRLRDSIGGKAEGEKLSAEESEALEAIEGCLDQIERQYGSLDAAGLPQVPCAICGNGEQGNKT